MDQKRNTACLSFRGLRSLDSHQGSTLDPLGSLQQPPDPQLSLAMIFGHWMLCLLHNCRKTGNFPFFILGLGFWIISMLGTGIRTPPPPPSGPFLKAMDFVIDIIKNGYMLPFHHTPDSCYSEKQQVSNQAQFIR